MRSCPTGGRRNRIATAATAVLAVTGTTLLGVGLAAQTAPPPPLAAARAAPAPAPPTPTGVSHDAPVGPLLPRSTPTRLDIPSLDVHHELMMLGHNPDGTVAVPPLSQVATPGWYRYSPTPGELGPSAIYGHVDAAAYGKGVFYALATLQPGDTVSVTRTDHTVAVFTVTAIHQYRKQTFPTLQVYGNLDHAGLRLITCGGPFDPTTRNYLDNIVVDARLTSAHR